VESLADLAILLDRWAARINLTGHRSAHDIARRLILDAAAQLQATEDVTGPPASIADLGSGAGFPGLPMAILSPATQIVLVDSRRRRHHFQRAAIREIRLSNARALLGRIEAVRPDPCQLVVAQAVARPNEILPLLVDWALPGGWIAIPGGLEHPSPGGHPEIVDSRAITYRVPLTGPQRTLWLGRRR
jgi:16S rRNA (guanine527-N7)-methyltransferase